MELIATDVPIQKINGPLFKTNGVELYIKREDMVHPTVSGNKFWKLKHNLLEAEKIGHKKLLTFGGAYSNHIHAVAAAGKATGFETIGVIRGEEHTELNPTLLFALDCGMRLYYLDRSAYRKKNDSVIQRQLALAFESFYQIPEGGSNVLAVKGCMEMVSQLQHFDIICCPVGTGGTLAGIIAANLPDTHILGFSALKGAGFLNDDVKKLLNQCGTTSTNNWSFNLDYHFGGYAKTSEVLFNFIKEFKVEHNVPLEPIYTGKMMFGIMDLINKGYFEPGTRLLAIHTGGLQGLQGFPELME